MSKAISSVVATVLMLMIVIALAGSAYMFVSGALTTRVATAFSIIDVYYGNVTIRNEGTANISSMTAIVDGKPVTASFPDGPIPPGARGTVTLKGLPVTKQKHNLRLCSPSMCNSWHWEYPIIAVYDADGENFYAYAWGRFSSNQIINWLNESGFAVAKVSSNNLAGHHWGFEKGMIGWTTHASPDEATTVDSIRKSGAQSLKVRVDTSKSWSGVITEGNYLINVKPNTRYLAEVYVYVPSSVTLTGMWEFHRHVYDETGGCGDGTCHHYTTIAADVLFDNSIEKGRWVRKWIILQTWSDAQTFRAFFVTYGWGGTGTVYWDDFQLVELDNNNNPVEPRRVELKDVDVMIISTGEGYPARGKGYGARGENIWNNTKYYLSTGGKMLVIGAYPFFYPTRWDGSNWVLDCTLAPCHAAAGNEIQLDFLDVTGNSIVKTSIGQVYFPRSATTASPRDYRPLKPGGTSCPQNQFLRFWNTDTGQWGVSMVNYGCLPYNGALLKVCGGGPDHVTALGGKTFIVESILVLLKS